MTMQERMHELLTASGIPAREIRVYGAQVMVTAASFDAASKWAALLGEFCRKVRSCESRDYCKENKGTNLLPSTVKVWRVWGTI